MTDRDLLDEQMDQRLRDYASLWREALPAPAEPAPTEGPPSRQWLAPLAAAAAVAVLIGGVFAVAERNSGEPDEPGGDPSTTAREGRLPCGAGDLVAGDERREDSAGTAFITVAIELAPGAASCFIAAHPPEVVLLDGDRRVPVSALPSWRTGTRDAIVLTEDQSAKVMISWAVSHHCREAVNDAILIRVGDGAELEVGGFGPTSCTPGDGLSSVQVAPVLPAAEDASAELGTLTGTVTVGGVPVTAGKVTAGGSGGYYEGPIVDGRYRIVLPEGLYSISVFSREWSRTGTVLAPGDHRVTAGSTATADLKRRAP